MKTVQQQLRRMNLEQMIELAKVKKDLPTLEGYAVGIPLRTDLSIEDRNYLVHKINNYRQILVFGR